MVETEPTVSKQNMAAKVPVKEDRARTLDDALLRVVSNFENVHDLSSSSQLLLSLSYQGMILSYLSPLGTENPLFINLRSRSQESCESTLNSGFLCLSIQ